MFPNLTRLYVRNFLIKHSLARFYSVKNSKVSTINEREYLRNYYINSGRHNVFSRESTLVYQFDDETRKLTTWKCPTSLQNIEWDQSVTCYNNIEMICAFESLLNYSLENNIPLSDEKFDGFVDDFTKRLQEFSLNELIQALQIFVRFPLNKLQMRERNYIELFHAFDQACTIKSQDLLPEQLLFIGSIWFYLAGSKKTWTAALLGRLFIRYMKNMSAPEMAQALYYINCMTQPIEEMRALENIFEKNIDDMTIQEVSTVLWTFIRLDTKIEKQELRDKFWAYLEKQDLSQLCESQLTKVLIITTRIFEPSMSKSAQWLNISRKLHESLQDRSLKMCILVANVGSPVRIFDNEIMSHVFNRCINHPEELHDLYMPDLEYLSRILSMTNHGNNELGKKIGTLILNEIINNRLDMIAQRGIFRNFSNIIRNLTMIDVYDLELLNNILSPDYIRLIYKRSKQLDSQIYDIDWYCRINLKNEYKGNLLPQSQVEKLCFLIDWIPDRVNRHKQIHEFNYAIEDVAEKLFTYSQYAHAIPSRKHADLIVCIDKNTLQGVDISKKFPELYKSHLIDAKSLTNANPNLMVFSLIASNTKEFSVDKFNKCESIPIGYLAQKITQLKILGFHPVVIPVRLFLEENPKKAIEMFIISEVNKELQANGINQQLKLNENE